MYIWGYMFVIVELMGKIKNTNRKEKPLETQTTRIYWKKAELTKEQALNKCEAEELFYHLLNSIKITGCKNSNEDYKRNLVEVLNFTKFHIDKWIDENQLREEVK